MNIQEKENLIIHTARKLEAKRGILRCMNRGFLPTPSFTIWSQNYLKIGLVLASDGSK